MLDLDGLRADAQAAHGLRDGRIPESHPTVAVADELGQRRPIALAARLRAAAFQATGSPQVVLDPAGVLVMANDLARRAFGLTASDLGRPCTSWRCSHAPSSSPSSSPPRCGPRPASWRPYGGRRRTGSGC